MKRISYILFIFLFIIFYSCKQSHIEKCSPGIYQVDFKGLSRFNFFSKFDTVFSKEEKLYYSNFQLCIKPNKTFYFSKPFYNEKITIKGYWEAHDDPLAGVIILRGVNSKYFTYHNGCDFGDIQIHNKYYLKRLPIKKIKNWKDAPCK